MGQMARPAGYRIYVAPVKRLQAVVEAVRAAGLDAFFTHSLEQLQGDLQQASGGLFLV